MIKDLRTIEWRGVSLQRVADLETYRRERYELFDKYDPALESCRWDAEGMDAAVTYEAGLWSAYWASACPGSGPQRTLGEALEVCDAKCRKAAAAHIKAAELLLRGLESGVPDGT